MSQSPKCGKRSRDIDEEEDNYPHKDARFYEGADAPKSRKVRFSAEDPTVHYFDVEYDDVHMGGRNEEGSEKNTSRLTEELTLLSSAHGRARRLLRDISKHDLQTAVKYGEKTPARTVKGEQRWKFEFGNVIYITDETCRREITCYHQAVDIQPANIALEMTKEHNETKLALKEDPLLCTTHSIIIIDQSGSMRTSDVNGFRSRSEAAYGTLALDYIAEQLYQRGDEDSIDTVTIIEMNNCGSIYIDHEPLDWILFNKLLDRKRTARPLSHGNYLASLQLAAKMIIQDQLLHLELDEDDRPAFMLVFLSDGRPSDRKDIDRELRHEIINNLANLLKSKLSVLGMGIGATHADFNELELMVNNAKENGANNNSQFVHAGLSCATLSSAFSSAATSMTATRTELISVGNAKKKKTEKSYTMRAKYAATREHPTRRILSASRWKYDSSTGKQGLHPWSRQKFKMKSASGFEVEKNPFGKGAERLAFRFFELAADSKNNWKRVGKMMVAKESLYIEDEGEKEKFHEVFCRSQLKARDLAEKFNHDVRKSPKLRPNKDEVAKPPKLLFLKCRVYEYTNENGENAGILVEDYLQGNFTKYNGNNGYLRRKKSGPTIDLEIGEVYLTDFVQAFSHWVYAKTDHKLLVCDLQGVLDEEGKYPKFKLTDPAICTKSKKNRYGKTDIGMRGIRKFCQNHKCNAVCRGLNLPPILGGKSEPAIFGGFLDVA